MSYERVKKYKCLRASLSLSLSLFLSLSLSQATATATYQPACAEETSATTGVRRAGEAEVGLRALSSPKRHHVSGTPDTQEIIAKFGPPKEKPLKILYTQQEKKASDKRDCSEKERVSKARSAKMVHILTTQRLRSRRREWSASPSGQEQISCSFQ